MRLEFWRRQFAQTVTGRQRIFDFIMGVIAPVLLLFFDPVLFNPGSPCIGANLVSFAPFFYLAMGVGILTLCGWIFVTNFAESEIGSAFVATVMLLGTVFAAGIGIILLPTALIGLFICIGVLGFVPFIVAFVYLRTGIRALRIAISAPFNPFKLVVAFLIGIFLVLAVPAFVQAQSPTVVAHCDINSNSSNGSSGSE